MKQMILCLCILIGWQATCLSQDIDSANSRLEQLVKKMNDEGYKPFNILQELNLTTYPPALLEKIAVYLRLPNPGIQERLYEVYFDYAIHSPDRQFRQQMVNKLLGACNDSINTSYACGYVSDLLKRLNKEDFDDSAKKTITGFLQIPRYSTNYITLAGFLALQDGIPYLEKIANEAGAQDESFLATLALARMNKAPYAKKIADSLRRIGSFSDLIIYHYEDLVYLKNREVLPLLEKILNSNERDVSLNPYVEGQKFAFRALNILALTVRDFPVPYEDGGITGEEKLKKARAWLKLNKNKVRFNTSKY
jgi:hypothetical protein